MTHQFSSTCGHCTLLTMSDSRTSVTDDSGDVIEQKLLNHGHNLIRRTIVPDEIESIKHSVQEVLDSNHESHFLITTGGSGIGVRDSTPEAVMSFDHTTLAGFGELFRMYSERDIGPRAMLSRAEAGILKQNSKRIPFFILPGSPHAVTLAMDACILPVIGHILDLCHTKEHA